MLVLSRKIGEAIHISPSPELNTEATTVAELFSEGPIIIEIKQTKGRQVKIGLIAPQTLSIKRKELIDQN